MHFCRHDICMFMVEKLINLKIIFWFNVVFLSSAIFLQKILKVNFPLQKFSFCNLNDNFLPKLADHKMWYTKKWFFNDQRIRESGVAKSIRFLKNYQLCIRNVAWVFPRYSIKIIKQCCKKNTIFIGNFPKA